MPAVKVYGFPFPDHVLEAWCDLVGLHPNKALQDRMPYALEMIAASTPWCGWDRSRLWAIVKGPPKEGFGYLKLLIVGSNETASDLQNANNAARVQAVREIIGDLEIEPAWYWRNHNFN